MRREAARPALSVASAHRADVVRLTPRLPFFRRRPVRLTSMAVAAMAVVAVSILPEASVARWVGPAVVVFVGVALMVAPRPGTNRVIAAECGLLLLANAAKGMALVADEADLLDPRTVDTTLAWLVALSMLVSVLVMIQSVGPAMKHRARLGGMLGVHLYLLMVALVQWALMSAYAAEGRLAMAPPLEIGSLVAGGAVVVTLLLRWKAGWTPYLVFVVAFMLQVLAELIAVEHGSGRLTSVAYAFMAIISAWCTRHHSMVTLGRFSGIAGIRHHRFRAGVITFVSANQIIAWTVLVAAGSSHSVGLGFAALGAVLLAGTVYLRWGRDLIEMRADARSVVWTGLRPTDPTSGATSGAMREVVAEELAEALHRGDRLLHYQPVVHVASGQFAGAEALLRFESPAVGPVAAELVVRIATEHGLAKLLTAATLREAIDDAPHIARLVGPDVADLYLGVNVTADDLCDPEFVGWLELALRDRSDARDALVLELTEHQPVLDTIAAARAIDALQILGVGVALDDFGAGLANLSTLTVLDVDVVKLDRSLFVAAAESPRAEWLLRSLIASLAAFDVRIVAEGIEASSSPVPSGVELVQGYAHGRAVPIDELRAAANLIG